MICSIGNCSSRQWSWVFELPFSRRVREKKKSVLEAFWCTDMNRRRSFGWSRVNSTDSCSFRENQFSHCTIRNCTSYPLEKNKALAKYVSPNNSCEGVDGGGVCVCVQDNPKCNNWRFSIMRDKINFLLAGIPQTLRFINSAENALFKGRDQMLPRISFFFKRIFHRLEFLALKFSHYGEIL
jgi:hypothetical protein